MAHRLEWLESGWPVCTIPDEVAFVHMCHPCIAGGRRDGEEQPFPQGFGWVAQAGRRIKVLTLAHACRLLRPEVAPRLGMVRHVYAAMIHACMAG